MVYRKRTCGRGLSLAGGARGQFMSARRVAMRRARRAKIGRFLGHAGRFVKKHKLVSRGAAAYASRGGPYGAQVGVAGKAAGMLGYGRKRACPKRCRRRVH